MELSNSTWCVDKGGNVVLIDSISGDDALVRRWTDGFGDLLRIPQGDLTQCTVDQLPEHVVMSATEAEALGYAASAPALARAPSRALDKD